jgi:hypothetical protein
MCRPGGTYDTRTNMYLCDDAPSFLLIGPHPRIRVLALSISYYLWLAPMQYTPVIHAILHTILQCSNPQIPPFKKVWPNWTEF